VSKFSLDAFLEATSARGPLRLEFRGLSNAPPRELELQQPFAVLGSSPHADITIEDSRISRRHAYCQIIDGDVFYLDLDSRTGSLWNGSQRSFGWLSPQRPVQLGNHLLRVVDDSNGAVTDLGKNYNPLASDSMGDHFSPFLNLEILAGHSQPIRWLANRVLTLIGKTTICKVRLHSPEVSRYHAAIICTPRGAWIVDLLSRTGIFVNQKAVRIARLDPGDLVRVGSFFIRIHRQEELLEAIHTETNRPLPVGVEVPGSLVPSGSIPVQGIHGQHSLDIASLSRALLQDGSFVTGLLQPVVEHFTWLQNQMFDQFQQNLLAMYQAFNSAHHDQVAELRLEIERVQEITRELHALQLELQEYNARKEAERADEESKPSPAASHATIQVHGTVGQDEAPGQVTVRSSVEGNIPPTINYPVSMHFGPSPSDDEIPSPQDDAASLAPAQPPRIDNPPATPPVQNEQPPPAQAQWNVSSPSDDAIPSNDDAIPSNYVRDELPDEAPLTPAPTPVPEALHTMAESPPSIESSFPAEDAPQIVDETNLVDRPAPGQAPSERARPARPIPERPDAAPRPASIGLIPPGVGAQDVHSWLYERMAVLQEERKNRWQKIIGFLTGKK
jgi:pSer/pThr/pTyr-binding forkhead associated (FHA) protein